jgi:hypothetical protein
MTDSDKIAIAAIVVNSIITIAGWFVAWFIAKKASQAALPVASPIAKPTRRKTRRITPFERRMIRHIRLVQGGSLLLIINELWSYPNSSLLLGSPPTLVDKVLPLVSIASSLTAIIALEFIVRRQIKSGEFAKALRKLKKTREESNTV